MIDEIIEQLKKSVSPFIIPATDLISLRKNAEWLISIGFNQRQALQWLRCTEEANCPLTEEQALRKMSKIHAEVKKGLKNEFQKRL